jgi:hypothetical protein
MYVNKNHFVADGLEQRSNYCLWIPIWCHMYNVGQLFLYDKVSQNLRKFDLDKSYKYI